MNCTRVVGCKSLMLDVGEVREARNEDHLMKSQTSDVCRRPTGKCVH